MTNEIIAVDLDDVLVATAPATIEYYNRTWNTTVRPEDFYRVDYAEAWQAPDKETAVRRVHEYIGSDEHFVLKPELETVEAISALQAENQLYVVTGRPSFIESSTRRWLAEYFPSVFADVVFSNYFDDTKVRDKGDICQELGVGVLIDDHPDHVFSAAEKDIGAILFGNYPWNQPDRLPDRVPDSMVRCVDWLAVREYFDARG